MRDKKITYNVITIEDPIEFVYEPEQSIIDQREIGIDTKDFPNALKSVFREDVNVIFIGEMRSPETIAAAVTAAAIVSIPRISPIKITSGSSRIAPITPAAKSAQSPASPTWR